MGLLKWIENLVANRVISKEVIPNTKNKIVYNTTLKLKHNVCSTSVTFREVKMLTVTNDNSTQNAEKMQRGQKDVLTEASERLHL